MRIPPNRLLIPLVLAGAGLFLGLFLFLIPQNPQVAGAPAPGLPIRLTISAINVDAAIERVGLTPNGAMDVPKDPATVVWYALGPRPGETGSAVIAGHYGWKNDLPAAFDALHVLKKGDKISVENDNGEIVMFVVRELRNYNAQDDASLVFNSNDGKAHLNLITCEGVWNKDSKSYSERLVVFADKE